MYTFATSFLIQADHIRESSGTPPMTEYYRNYLAVFIFIAAAVAMCVGILAVGRLLRPVRPQPEKYIVYESGSDPIGGFGQSHIRYYIFALLFVIFDVEAVFVFPWAINVNGLGAYGFWAMSIFLIVLLIGLAYDWRKGLLQWA
ncbi:MAG TPA: NADH-quinone oxidoreductase subunit A [Acidimicrobiia bacterium]|nr:NADH-quinone oxidoreductase subunit A [Acidimicrobiia bacterium]